MENYDSESASRPLISVIICTYNRADLLCNALRGVCEQTLEKSHYEVIVVDNNSKDNTYAVVEDFCGRYPNVRYCREESQGLSYARNRGWREARGEYVAYIDDDCKVPEQWLAGAKDVIERISPGVFGGPFFPFYNSQKTQWYKDSYGSHEPGKVARILNQHDCINIYGGNSFFRRALLEACGGFDPKLGMAGNKIAYSEETVMIKLISRTMPDQIFYYDPRLFVYHLVPAKKMTLRWMWRSFFAHGRSSYYYSNLKPQGKLQLLRQGARVLRVFAVDLARSILYRNRTRYPYLQNYLHEHTFPYLYTMGKIYEQYVQLPKQSQVEDRVRSGV